MNTPPNAKEQIELALRMHNWRYVNLFLIPRILRRMESSGMLRRVALIITDVSEEFSTSIIRVVLRSVRRLLVTAKVVPSSPILVTLMMEALSSSETSDITRATWRDIPEDIFHSHRRENLKSFKNFNFST
jgi:hypothetical protein